jgi:HSP20 family protein
MAKQDVKSGEPQTKQPGETTGSSRSSSQSSSLPARRGGGLEFPPLTPVDFFGMNPFSVMRRIAEDMDRVFGGTRAALETSGTVPWSPPIEVSEGEGKYVVRAELAGLKPEDVKLEVEDGALTLQGEKKSEQEEKAEGIQRTEIRYGRFYRTIPLPEGANIDQVSAKFDNGVLEVTVPVSEQETQRRQIPIQKASAASAGAVR